MIENLFGIFSKKELEEDPNCYLDQKTLNSIAQRLRSFDSSTMDKGLDPELYRTQSDGAALMHELVSPLYGKSHQIAKQITAWVDTLDKKLKEGRIQIITLPKYQWSDLYSAWVSVEYDHYADSLTRVKTMLFREGIREDFINYPGLRQKISDAIFNAISQAR